MRTLIFGSLFLAIVSVSVGCSTIVPMVEPGTVEPIEASAAKKQALVVMQYDFNVNDIANNYSHIVYIFDSNKRRYDIHVPAGYPTAQGVAFYLPADQQYAVVGMYISKIHGTDFSFGKDLDLFALDTRSVNVLPMFAMREIPNTSYFVGVQQKDSSEKNFQFLRSRFKNIENFKQLKVELFPKP